MLIKSLSLLCFFFMGYSNSYSQDVFSTVESKIANQLLAHSHDKSLAKNVVSYLPQLQNDGSWADIDYSNAAITKWEVSKHLDRVKNFAISYIKPGSPYFEHSDLYNAIVNALRFWYKKDPKSKNWWHNEIASPQSLGQIMILMGQAKKDLPKGLKDSLTHRMNRGDVFKQTGANKLDVATHTLYRACITRNKGLMDTAVSQAFQPIQFTTQEGLQYDYSYLQHGPQLQIASYGVVFLSGEYKVASWLIGTPYALSEQKTKLLGHYLTQTFLPSIRGRYSDFNIEGRRISRPNALDYKRIANSKGDSSLLQIAELVSPEDKQPITSAIQRITQAEPPSYGIVPVHNLYWIGDYTQHQRPAYNFNVRMVSDRTKRTETGNKENLLGKFLPDGSTDIQLSGKEYFNIMPVWEWDKIPGITCRDFKEDQSMTVQWGEMGSTKFVGGVSDSVYGATAYDMDYNDVKAKKSWFFFDKELVCLGAGISSNAPENLVTTVNQCWLNGKIITDEAGKIRVVKTHENSKDINWVWHDNVGYFFPQKGDITVSGELQTGNWKEINAAYSEDEISGKVFKMWFDHGAKPSAASYSYIVVPGISQDEMKDYPEKEVVILSNTASIQAVEQSGLKIIQAVFYQPGTLTTKGISVTVNKPCIVMLKTNNDMISISIADPTHEIKDVEMIIKSAVKNSERKLICHLPEGNMAGSSSHFFLKL